MGIQGETISPLYLKSHLLDLFKSFHEYIHVSPNTLVFAKSREAGLLLRLIYSFLSKLC